MSYPVKPQVKIDGHFNILYDPTLVESPTADLFNVDSLKGQGVLEGTAGGRGASSIVRLKDKAWVVRHYRRGGLMGKLLDDQYFGCNREKSRSWSEWRLLHLLYNEGFPVPRPVAASFIPSVGIYRADLITEFLLGSRTLAEILTERNLSEEKWTEVGACIARFHNRGVYHADLNAHNILLDEAGRVFLLDFDKGEVRKRGGWRKANISRLQRSFLKLASQRPGFSFDADGWKTLQHGYSAITSL